MTKIIIHSVLLGLLSVASAVPSNMKRDVLKALPENADGIEKQWQPYLDFDTDSCYNTAAIDPSGKTNPGLPLKGTVSQGCRDAARLDNANVYSRRRCNKGVCGIMYEYYYEKDQSTNEFCNPRTGICSAGGHVNDWENVIVFTKGQEILRVAPSCHGGYGNARNAGNFLTDGTHPLIVYHKDGGLTHCHRLANADDRGRPENVRGKFVRSPLVGWLGFPNVGLRTKMNQPIWGGPIPKTSQHGANHFGDALRDAGAAGVGLDPYGPDE